MAGQIKIQGRLIELFRDKLELDVPSAETDLMETGVMDSLTFVELLYHLEIEFGITISNEKLELENFRSIISIVEFVEQVGELIATQGDKRGLVEPERSPYGQGASIHPALPTWPDPTRFAQGLSSLDQRAGRADRRHDQSRDSLSMALRLDCAVGCGSVWVRTALQRTSALQRDRWQDACTAHAQMVSPITQPISPATSRSVHNLMTLDT